MRRQRSGFTLVEVLVVIGIIAVLLGILIPIVGKARREATGIKCLGNMRALLAAVTLYENQNENILPFDGWSSAPVQNWLVDARKAKTWTTADLKGGSLWPFINNEKGYRCVADEGPWPASTILNMTSYTMNGAVNGYGLYPNSPSSPSNNTSMSSLQFHPDDILFWEIPSSAVSGGGVINDGTNYPSEGVSARHSKGTAVGFMDGHGEIMSGAEFQNLASVGPSKAWCDPTRADGGRSIHATMPTPFANE